jgi:predicted protein tyrosine phosphatase
MTLVVCSLRHLPSVLAARAPSHLISLLAPENMIETPAGVSPDRHLRLGVHDIPYPQAGLIAPDAAMVEEILAFGRGWYAAQPMLIHCHAGISRSTASAFIIACDRNPAAEELQIALHMRRISPQAFPNRRLVAFADDILGRQGRMLEAVEAMGGNDFGAEGVPFDLPAKH